MPEADPKVSEDFRRYTSRGRNRQDAGRIVWLMLLKFHRRAADPHSSITGAGDYLQIRIVDRQTGRGVPLVGLITYNARSGSCDYSSGRLPVSSARFSNLVC